MESEDAESCPQKPWITEIQLTLLQSSYLRFILILSSCCDCLLNGPLNVGNFLNSFVTIKKELILCGDMPCLSCCTKSLQRSGNFFVKIGFIQLSIFLVVLFYNLTAIIEGYSSSFMLNVAVIPRYYPIFQQSFPRLDTQETRRKKENTL